MRTRGLRLTRHPWIRIGRIFGAAARWRPRWGRPESEQRLAALTEAIPDAIFLLSAEGRFLDYKPGRRFTPVRPPEAFLGRAVQDVLPPEPAAAVMQALGRVRASGEPVEIEVAVPGADGMRHFELALGSCGDGEAIVVTRDVTERVTATAALRVESERRTDLARRLLETQITERHALARDLHDGAVQQLTGAVLQLSAYQAQASGGGPPTARDHLTRAFAYLESGLVDLRRLLAGLGPLDLEELGLATALSEREAVRSGRTVTAHVNLPGVQPGEIAQAAIYWIVQAAVANALQHSGSPRVEVQVATQDRETLAVVVQDWGTGIEPGVVARATAGRHGLGLAAMRERAELLGGTVRDHFGARPGYDRVRLAPDAGARDR